MTWTLVGQIIATAWGAGLPAYILGSALINTYWQARRGV